MFPLSLIPINVLFVSGLVANEPGDVAAEATENPETEEGSRGGEPGPSGTQATSYTSDFSAILGDIEIPEGVDPSFLAALPEDMRAEVIEEQRRLLRARAQPPAPPAQQVRQLLQLGFPAVKYTRGVYFSWGRG